MECARAIAKKNIATLIEIKKMFTIHERTMMPIPQEYLLSLNLAGRYGDGFTLGINSFLKKGNENG
jgi:hypothetical protein